MILLDTSILIDYYRKSKKENTVFKYIVAEYGVPFISEITHYEIIRGANETQNAFWLDIFVDLKFIDFDNNAAIESSNIYKQLKAQNKLIETADIFIAATAIANNLSLATLNVKHFNRIENLKIINL